ncbi:DUF4349 domain-containing protein [Alkaliphilus peptidifermentans]|uniref:Putative zinc-finger n=1 Tax=Alkaliphilus peptidifermentans DSM 18978 TaxID=1120976 RepID=A0A1G5CV20_9FIRM|nr:DUF4349 domain-containing protein [Alkaliphilus peptidifermentans]SCY06157.1 Putative zinc-finger [Alkaliphilus peptidifermentans DSM 18978]
MDCKNFDYYSSLYIDEILTEDEKIKFEKHLEECTSCKLGIENLKIVLECLDDIPEVELPSNFNETLREKLKMETGVKEGLPKKKGFNLRIMKGIAAGLLILLVTATAYNSLMPKQFNTKFQISDMAPAEAPESMNSARAEEEGRTYGVEIADVDKNKQFSFNLTLDDSNDESAVMDTAEQEMMTMGATEEYSEFKFIHTGNIRIETVEFDRVYASIMQLVDDNNGYIQQAESYYRYINRERPEESMRAARLTVRVPSETFKGVFHQFESFDRVISQNIDTDNITETYRDTETQVRNLEIQEERLQEILSKAEKVDDLLRIENELSRVRLEMNRYLGNLKTYDRLVAMSTIHIDLEEVRPSVLRIQSVNDGLWGKAKNNFVQSVNRLIRVGERSLIGLFGILPHLFLISVFIGPIGWVMFKKYRKGRMKE